MHVREIYVGHYDAPHRTHHRWHRVLLAAVPPRDLATLGDMTGQRVMHVLRYLGESAHVLECRPKRMKVQTRVRQSKPVQVIPEPLGELEPNLAVPVGHQSGEQSSPFPPSPTLAT